MAISAFIGVGGGFLYVPFLTSVAGLPMFIVAGTSALAVLVGMITNIFNLHGGPEGARGFRPDRHRTHRHHHRLHPGSGHLQEDPRGLAEAPFVVLAVYVGIGYITKGSWVNPSSRECERAYRNDLRPRATGARGPWARASTMEMPVFFLWLDPYLIRLYRLTGQAYADFFLGTLALAFLAVILGEMQPASRLLAIRKRPARPAAEAGKYRDLSLEALKPATR